MIDKAKLNAMTPKEAILKLLEGNKRFRNNQHTKRNFMDEVQKTAKNQYPFAIVLGCIDSRVPIEVLFDQKIGNLFVTRIAGNFENNDVIAGMEYACEVVGSKLIMVLGHENCGAIKATCDDVKLGHITELVNKLKPAISQTKINGAINSKNKECVDAVSETNVKLTIKRILEKSEILKRLNDSRQIKVVGAFYHLSSGKVEIINK
jgi:carbonic anhydrase